MASLLSHGMPPQAWFLLLFPLLLVVHYLLARKRSGNSHGRLPPSPPALPIIGHLHLVGTLPHVSLRSLSRKYGPDLMLLRLGAVPTLVVSSPRAAEAVLRTHDRVFASRPTSMIADIIMKGCDVGFAPNGEHWRQARRLISTHLLSLKKVQSLRRIREEEVGMVMDKLSEAADAGGAVDMSELLNSFMNGIVCRAVSGRFVKTEGRDKLVRDLSRETSELLGGFNIEEYFPILSHIRILRKSVCARAERVKKGWDELLDKIINEHERERNSACDYREGDFIDVMLSIRHEYGFERAQMKAILVDVFFGSTDTTSAVLEFAIVELMRWPHFMNKLQAEVRTSIPKGKQFVSEDDLNTMTYLKAVLKEALRLHPAAPLLAPHLSMANCSIDGYTIPTGTRIFVNTWAIGRDADSWEDAEEFRPDRFVDDACVAQVNFKGSDFQFLPFGAGRRMCPGMNFGMASIELMLANLIYRFDWELPQGLERKDIDMTEVFGLTVGRKEKLVLFPRSHV